MQIPPKGDEGVASWLNQIVQESTFSDRRARWESEVDRWLSDYVGETPSESASITELAIEGGRVILEPESTVTTDLSVKVEVNRVQNCVIAMMAIQAGEPPRFNFSPREIGEPPVTMLNTLKPEAPLVMAQFGIVDPKVPLDPAVADQIRTIIAAGQAAALQALAVGMPAPAGLLPTDILAEISDSTLAEFFKIVVNGMWEAGMGQFYFGENVLNKNILGWQPTSYEVESELKIPVFHNENVKHVFLPPEGTNPARHHYVIIDKVKSADEMRATYPELAGVLVRDLKGGIGAVTDGTLQFSGGNYQPSDVYAQQFHRDMVVMRHAWFQWQEYPMTKDEAIGTGRITEQMVPTLEMQSVTDEIGQPMSDPMTGETVTEPMTRPAMMREDGTEVVEGHPRWPNKFAIREIATINNVVVIDRECKHRRIPVAINVNIPIPYSPYGQGEPKRLQGPQKAFNQAISSVASNLAYAGYPVELILASVHERIGKALKKCRTSPNQRVVVPDDTAQDAGGLEKVIANIAPPQMGSDTWKFIDFLRQIIDNEGNLTDVMQGNAAPGWSGEAINSLQNAASQVIKAKSQRTEHYLKHLCGLMLDTIRFEFTSEDCLRYSDKYPPAIVDALYSRGKITELDISVEISSGSGQAKSAETNNLMAARQAGVPVSNETLLERFRLDPKAEQQKVKVEAAEQQATQPTPATGSDKQAA